MSQKTTSRVLRLFTTASHTHSDEFKSIIIAIAWFVIERKKDEIILHILTQSTSTSTPHGYHYKANEQIYPMQGQRYGCGFMVASYFQALPQCNMKLTTSDMVEVLGVALITHASIQTMIIKGI